MQIPEAEKLPLRAESKGAFTTTAIYTLPGQIGLYRRVSREGRTSLTPGPDCTLAIIPAGNRDGEPVGGLCELKRWKDGENVLAPVLAETTKPF